jgi:hypothetical protein
MMCLQSLCRLTPTFPNLWPNTVPVARKTPNLFSVLYKGNVTEILLKMNKFSNCTVIFMMISSHGELIWLYLHARIKCKCRYTSWKCSTTYIEKD